MRPSSTGYLKTTVLAASSGALVIGLTLVAARDLTGLSRAFVESSGWLVGLASMCVALAGAVTLLRSKRQAEGRRDLFLDLNASRDLEAVSRGGSDWGLRVRQLIRLASGASHPLVGDLVEVRPLEEIESTLDESGCLEGLPFMPEMGRFCGRRIRVFRCVDKVLDFGRSWRRAPAIAGPGQTCCSLLPPLPVHAVDRGLDSDEPLGSAAGAGTASQRERDGVGVLRGNVDPGLQRLPAAVGGRRLPAPGAR